MSSYTKEKLEYLKETKRMLRQALITQGQEVSASDPFRTYPDKVLGIAGGMAADVRYVIFMDHTGTVELGRKAVATGDDCADPIARGIFDKPTKESDEQYNYTFSGWATEASGSASSSALKAVTVNRTLYAAYSTSVRYYTITFYDSDGTTVLKTQTVAYGSTPSYTPTKDGYDFVAWTPALSAVTGDTSYTATWKVKATFETTSWSEIAAICDTGNAANTFKVGDRKPVTLTYADGTTETIYFRIVDMGVDVTPDGAAAPLTLMADNLVRTSLKPASAYNKADREFYDMDNVKTMMTELYNAMPAELKAAIKTVRKYDNAYRQYDQQVFIPSRKNLTGVEYSTDSATTINKCLLPQKQYAYFVSGGSIARSKLTDSSYDAYWTSTCKEYTTSSYTTAYFEVLDGTSFLGSKENASSKSYGVCPCFCI